MLNEQKVTYRMKTLMESGFFGNKSLLTEAFADKDKVRLFQSAYNRTYNKNIAVDGIKGTQTNAAIEDVKKQPSFNFEKLDNANAEVFYLNFLDILKMDNTINVGRGGNNSNKTQNTAIQTLLTLAGQPLAIDGIVGEKTMAAIKTATGADTINKDNIVAVIEKAKANIKELGIEDITTVQSGAANANAAQAEQGGTKVKFGICLKGNCENGVGELKSEVESTKGNIYIGTFIDSYLTGKDNEIKYASGNSFKGETLDGYPKNGTYTFKSGSTFTGTFYPNSVRSYHGSFKSHEGWSYWGYFNQKDQMHGNNSTYTNKNGKAFRLNFTNGNPVGYTWSQLDSQEDNGTVTVTKEANNSLFAAEMAKFKGIIDAKIQSGDITSKNNIFSGNYTKVENGLQILDANNSLLFTTTAIPFELKETQGKWSYYTGGGGYKLMNFGNSNDVTKYVYTYPDKDDAFGGGSSRGTGASDSY